MQLDLGISVTPTRRFKIGDRVWWRRTLFGICVGRIVGVHVFDGEVRGYTARRDGVPDTTKPHYLGPCDVHPAAFAQPEPPHTIDRVDLCCCCYRVRMTTMRNGLRQCTSCSVGGRQEC